MELIRVPKVENVKLVDRLNYANPDVGTLYLTPTHVIFVDPNSKKEYWILLMHVCSVEKLPTSPNGCPLFIKCIIYKMQKLSTYHIHYTKGEGCTRCLPQLESIVPTN